MNIFISYFKKNYLTLLVFFLILSSFFLNDASNFSYKLPLLVLLFFSLLSLFFIGIDYFDSPSFVLINSIVFFTFLGFSILPYNEYLKDNVFIIVFGVNFSLLFLLDNNFVKFYKNLKSGTKFFLFLYCFALVISILVYNSEDFFSPYGFFKNGAYFISLLTIPVISKIFFTENHSKIDIFLNIINYFGLITAVFGILTIFSPGLNSFNSYEGTAISFFKHPNATSSIYNFSIPVTYYFILFGKKQSSTKILNWIILILSSFALFFTFSRFGIITVFLSLFIITYKKSKKFVFFFLLFLPVTLIFSLSEFFVSKGTGTVFGRLGLMATTITMLTASMEKLFWGYGIVSTTKVFEDVKLSLNVPDLNNVPHNIILYSILQFGLISTIPLIYLGLRYTFKGLVKFFNNSFSNYQLLGFSIFIGLIVKNMAEDLLIFPEFPMFYLLLIFVGISFVEFKSNNQNSNI